MMRSPSTLLIDTNVWLDYFDPDRSGHNAAILLLDKACRRGVPIMYAVTSIKDVFYIMGASLKKEVRQKGEVILEGQARAITATCWGIVETMGELGTPVGADVSDFWLARKYRSLHSDLEDNFVLAAAQRVNVDVLVTNDAKLIQHAPICAMTAQDACTYLEMGSAV